DCPDLVKESRRGERLREKRQSVLHDTSSPERVSGVAGHKEHLDRRNLAPNPIRQFAAVYARQNDVRQQKIDCGWFWLLQQQHRLGAARGFDRAIPMLL